MVVLTWISLQCLGLTPQVSHLSLAIWSLITFHFILFGLGVVFIDIVFTALLAAHILLVRRYYDHGHAPEVAEALHSAALR